MGGELSLAFVCSTNSYYNSSYDFFFPVRIYFTGKNMGHIKKVFFGEAEKLPLDLILLSIILHIHSKDERAESHLKC